MSTLNYCTYLYKINSDKQNADNPNNIYYSVYFNYFAVNSDSYENAVKNIKKSKVLENLENWYTTNIESKKDINNNSLSNYLTDSIFCNDRSNNSNYYQQFKNVIYYGPYSRVTSNNPKLKCPNDNDKFTISLDNGNGKLDYPIGLPTTDEIQMAGITASSTPGNKLSYLSYPSTYLTSSPYYSWINSNYIYYYSNTGYLAYGNYNSSYGMRPVINLKANTKIVSGEGTEDSPFEITIGN